MKSLLSLQRFCWICGRSLALARRRCLIVAGAEESAREPLWQLAIRQVKKSSNLTASKVVTQITVRDGADVFLGSVESVDVVSVPEKDALTWVNVSKKSIGSPGITMELNLRLRRTSPGNIPRWLLRIGWTKAMTLVAAGRPVGAVAGRRHGGPRGSAGHALAYLDPDTARPLQVDLVLPIHSNFGTRLVSVTVSFGSGPDDASVPVNAVIDQSGRFMFWKRHLIITKSFQELDRAWFDHAHRRWFDCKLNTGASTKRYHRAWLSNFTRIPRVLTKKEILP